MTAFWWSLLNLLAWGFGLKAVLDLRAESPPRAKTWFLVTQAVLSCLTMEAAMMGAAYLGGLAVLSSLTGISAGILMWLAARSLVADSRLGRVQLLRGSRKWDRIYAGAALAGTAGSVVFGLAMPRAATQAEALLHPVEGVIWLATAVGILITLARQTPTGPGAQEYAPRAIAVAFVFVLADSATTPFAYGTGIFVPPQVPMLLRTLFILTFVTTLYATVIQVRSRKLVEALTQLRGAQEQIFSIEKLAAVSTMAAGAAHDFNNSLMAIMGYLTLALEDERLSRQTRDDLDQAQRAAQAAAAITANLLGAARGASASQSRPCRTLRGAVEGPLEMLRPDLRRHHIEVVTHLDEVGCGGLDASLISQVCLNLYVNARDAMVPKGGGTLDVSLVERDGEVEITVRDTGVGIPVAFRPRMFQPLQTTKGERGTGLGLSSSRSALAAMGGRITYDTEADRGSTFHVFVPAHAGAAASGPDGP